MTDALRALVEVAQRTGQRLTLTVSGNVLTARWSRGRGRRAEHVTALTNVDYDYTLEDVVDVLAKRVLPRGSK